ncbi:FUSC family protein [Rhodoligotrophos ferricapiens]|uniref:FUSC family protein n=1 Tax=Rhodoligotrophos ferricapiens TaxID=3069264 RepID=UPI00315D64E3
MVRARLMEFARYEAEARFALRATVAGVATYLLVVWLGLPQGFWAVVTAVLVVQASVGGTIKFAIDRFIGTLAGAAAGAVAAVLIPHDTTFGTGVAIGAALLPLGFIAALKPSFRIAPVTAMIVLLSPSHLDPVTSALDRVLEIALGDVVGMIVAVVFLPARAHQQVADTTSSVLDQLADLVVLLGTGISGHLDLAAVQRQHAALRQALRKLDGTMDEAKRERDHHLSGGPDAEPMVRTVNRLRSDLIIIGRVAASPGPPDPMPADIADAVDAVMEHGAALLRDMGRSLRDRTQPPALDGYSKAVDRFKAGQGRHRRSESPSPSMAARLAVLSFAFDQFTKDARDMAGRVADFAARRAALE